MKNASVRGQAGPVYAAEFPEGVRGRGALAPTSTWPARATSAGRARTTSPWVVGTGYGVRLIAELARGRSTKPNYDLSEEHELVRLTVRDFAPAAGGAGLAEELDREHRFPVPARHGARRARADGDDDPEEYGGAGTDTLSYAIAVEE